MERNIIVAVILARFLVQSISICAKPGPHTKGPGPFSALTLSAAVKLGPSFDRVWVLNTRSATKRNYLDHGGLSNRVHFIQLFSKMAEEARRRVIEQQTTDDEDSKLVFETSEEVKVTRTFDQMKLKEDLIRGIFSYGNHFNLTLPKFFFFSSFISFLVFLNLFLLLLKASHI